MYIILLKRYNNIITSINLTGKKSSDKNIEFHRKLTPILQPLQRNLKEIHTARCAILIIPWESFKRLITIPFTQWNKYKK